MPKEKAQKIVKKTSPKPKVPVKRVLKKKPLPKPKAKTSSKADKSKKKKPKQIAAVRLPTNMSLRAIDKSEVVRQELDIYIQKSVYLVAYVSAICFILVGSTLALSEIFSSQYNNGQLKAELIGTTDDIVNTNTVAGSANADILTNIPNNIVGTFEVNFTVTNASKVRAFVKPLNGTNAIAIDLKPLLENKYQVKIPDSLESGYYYLKIAFEPDDKTGKTGITSREFFIGSKEAETVFNQRIELDVDIIKETVLDSNEMVIDETSLENTSVISTVSNTKDLATTTEVVIVGDSVTYDNDPQSDLNNSLSFDPEPSIPEDIETEKPEAHETKNNFYITKPKARFLSGPVNLELNVPSGVSYAELYSRPLNSLNYTFVTIATQRPNQWIFVVDTVNIPDNEYEFYAKVKYGAELYETKPIKVSIKNPKLLETSVTNITNNNEKVVQVEDATREFLPFSDKALSLNSSERDVMAVTAELIEDNHLALNDLLAKYSVAKQSGDKILIFTAEGNLNDFRSSLVNTTLQNAQLKDLADDIDQEIEMYLDLLKAKINIFEDIRKAKSNGESARDIDGDGVSDFDEIYIYKTNPNLVDTDNDGFNDGVEIIQGFDPNNGQSEAVLEFESPKDTKLLIRKDVLRIDSVIPLVYKDETVEVQSKVKSEIYGTALPLSFVNLYIFSSPTVVTIKTDADGSFVYTYDKELEDGRHDVYVAITDNTGSIIAQSEPFSFVKEAQAFTPIDKRETSMVTSDITPVTTSSYNVVFGLAVLSLGIILLMLGMGLKTKEDVIIATEAKTVKGGATTEPSF